MAYYVITNQGKDIPFEDCNDEVNRVVQNAKNLLMCQLGEVPFDRLRGFDMSLYSLPLNEFQAELPREIDRIMMWEPHVNVISATAEVIRSENSFRDKDILISVTIDVKIQE